MATSSLGSPNDGRGVIGLHPVWMTLQPTEGVRPYVRKNRQMRPSNAVRTVWNAEAIVTSHLLPSNPEIATIHASSGFIRGIPTYTRHGPRTLNWLVQTGGGTHRTAGLTREKTLGASTSMAVRVEVKKNPNVPP
jgi:hypothetical protein